MWCARWCHRYRRGGICGACGAPVGATGTGEGAFPGHVVRPLVPQVPARGLPPGHVVRSLVSAGSPTTPINGQQRWIRKNRKPIINVTDRFPSGGTSYNVVDFGARNAFWNYFLGWFRITEDWSLSQTFLKESASGDIGVLRCHGFPGKEDPDPEERGHLPDRLAGRCQLFPENNSFWVTSNGNTYVRVTAHADWNDTRIYKNGTPLYKSNNFRKIRVVEE